MTLEEQLRAVQKQLEALAHLPSAIQLTLDAVSKQLATIVGTNDGPQDIDENGENDDRNQENSERNDEGIDCFNCTIFY